MATERIRSILKSVNDKVQQLIATDRFYAALYDPVKRELEFPLVVEDKHLIGTNQKPWIPRPYQERVLPDQVIGKKQLLLLEQDLTPKIEQEEIIYWPDSTPPLSWLGIPLIFEDHVIGVLVVENRRRVKAFGEGEVRVLSTIARQTTMAIENAQLYERLERKIASLRAVNEVGHQLTSGIRLEEPDILELVYKQVTKLQMDTRNMYIALYNEDKNIISFGLAMNNNQPVNIESRPFGHGLTEYVIRTKQPYCPSDVKKAYATIAEDYIGKIPLSWMGVPMMVENKVLGVVVLRNDEYENIYDADDLEVLQAIASQAAVAIENARLYSHLDEMVQERTKQLAAIQEIGVEITSELDLAQVLGLIIDHTSKIAEADFTTLFTYDHDQNRFEKGIRRGKIKVVPSIPSNSGDTANIAKAQKAVFYEGTENELQIEPTFIGERMVRAFAGIPLTVMEKTVGVLYVNYFEPHSFSKEEREIIHMLANQAAVAIENARLYQRLGMKLSTTEKQREALQQLIGLNDLTGRFVHKVSNLAGTAPLTIEFIQDELNKPTPDHQRISQDLSGARDQIQQLLDMARRIQKSTQRLKETGDTRFLQEIDARELLDKALIQARGVGKTPRWENCVVVKEYEDYPLVIRTFESLFTEALNNIISNAFEAMPDRGTLTLGVALHQAEKEARQAVLKIADTGIGIPDSDFDRLYDIDYSNKQGGFGYGLWLVRRVCDATGTRIEVKSRENEGTTFYLFVPLVEDR